MSYERVKKNWITGLWGIQQLKLAYRKGIITLAQYAEIKVLPQAGQGNEE